jgi:hypothetical protein
MGLADRFKDKIQDKDIFESSRIVENKTSTIKFISKPISKGNKTENFAEGENFISAFSLEDLETEIISKIRKTPYWEEYTIQRQEKMISSYLHAKSNLINKKVSLQNEKQFIQDVLALSNSR